MIDDLRKLKVSGPGAASVWHDMYRAEKNRLIDEAIARLAAYQEGGAKSERKGR